LIGRIEEIDVSVATITADSGNASCRAYHGICAEMQLICKKSGIGNHWLFSDRFSEQPSG
jgi:hypothetical protein